MARTVLRLIGVAAVIAAVSGAGSNVILSGALGQAELAALNGKKLFEKETFGGNGRTCRAATARPQVRSA